jgi:NADH-quinone oxidoreductase subunit A
LFSAWVYVIEKGLRRWKRAPFLVREVGNGHSSPGGQRERRRQARHRETGNPNSKHPNRVEPMISQYIPVVVGIVWAVFLAVLLIGSSYLFGPRHLTASKTSVYECGVEPLIGDARSRFSIKFYVTAVLFLLFDIEVVYLYPWAILLRKLGVLGLVEMLGFLLVLLVALVYILKKGALNWE